MNVICPECKSIGVEDFNTGEIICSNCSVVLKGFSPLFVNGRKIKYSEGVVL